MDFFRFNRNIQKIDPEILIIETFDEVEKDIVLLNQSQLKKGKTTTGSKIKPSYKSDRYALMKNRQNSQPGLGTPDLFRTGGFYAEFFGIMENNIWEVSSFSNLTPILANKYDNIFGLDKENTETINDKADNIYIDKWLKRAGL